MTDLRSLIADARYEVIPLKNLEPQLEHIPTGASVSVTCSFAKGQQTTLDLARRIQDLGHMVVPHISARLTEDDVAVKKIAEYCRELGLQEIFLVAGDAPEPVGKYDGVVTFLKDFLGHDHGLQRIGVTAYPDGHSLIPKEVVHAALHEKQALLAEAGIGGFASTQMHFDTKQWIQWARDERAAGFTLPLHIGAPGAVDRAKLISLSTKLDIGSSVRFLKKNSGAIFKMFRPGGYDPVKFLSPLAKVADELNLEGVHLFTFNNVDATAEWQRAYLAKHPR
jgi:methylenetetrahydrofolate reductase (NADPH)